MVGWRKKEEKKKGGEGRGGAILIVPGLLESGQVKLLSGEQEALRQWQRGFAFKSLLALVDRDGAVTGATTDTLSRLQSQAFRPTTQAEADRMHTRHSALVFADG